jgi:hypothetical protein
MNPMMAMASQMMQQMGQNKPGGMAFPQAGGMRRGPPPPLDWKAALLHLPSDLQKEWKEQIVKDEARQQVGWNHNHNETNIGSTDCEEARRWESDMLHVLILTVFF